MSGFKINLQLLETNNENKWNENYPFKQMKEQGQI